MEISRRTVFKYAGAVLITVAAGTQSTGEALGVNIDPTRTTPLPANFGGYNPDFQVVAMQARDPQAAALARELRAGTLRYPSGTDSDYFDLRTGDVRPEWAAQFFGKMTAFDAAREDTQIIGAKPNRHLLSEFKELLDEIGADTVIIVNGFTDTPESAGAVAAYCVANNIRVAAYELCNEGWLLPTFFMDGTDYARRMKAYYDAIKAADPQSQVNVMFSQGEAPAWDQALAAYPDKYWDGISFHMYGGGDRYSSFEDAVKDLNTRLADRTNSYIDSYYLAKGRPDMRVTVSEFNSSPSTMTTLSTSGIIRTLYNGIFAAEFLTRLSSHPNVDRVMLHGLVQFGTSFTKPYTESMKNAYERGQTLDTRGFDYGIVRHGSALALSVALDAVNRSSHSLATTSDGTLTVAKYGGTVPAVYAQAYVGTDGHDYLVVTNKSSTPHSLTVSRQGSPLSGPFEIRFISSDNPREETLAVQESTSTNPVLVPAYSVMRIRWSSLDARVIAAEVSKRAIEAAPAAPTLDYAAPGDGQVVLAWQPVAGAKRYIVSYGTTGSVDVGNAIGATIRGLTNGVTSVFSVRSANSCGTSAASNAIAATPTSTIPYAPHTVLAAAGTSGTLVWWKPSYKRVLNEDFEAGPGGWDLTGAWSVQSLTESKRLCIDGSAIGVVGSEVTSSHFVGAEIAFANVVSGSAGLVLRYVDESNYVFAIFDCSTATHSIWRVSGGVPTMLAETAPITDPYSLPKAGRQYTYRLELAGSVLVLFRDGSEMVRAGDAGAHGRAGIISTAASISVDRFHVEADTATGFDIMRAADPAGPYTLVAENQQGTGYLDTAATSSDNYYRVAAVTGTVRSVDASHPAPARLKNVARDATITASSTLAGTATARLVDGIKNLDSSRWVSLPGEPHTVDFTWTSAKTIGRVCVYTGFMANRGFQISAFDIQCWVGGAWQSVASVVGNTKDAFDGSFNEVSFAPISTTKLRLNITDACAAPGYSDARVLEMEIYGK